MGRKSKQPGFRVFAAASLLASPAAAQSWFEREQLTGDWDGARATLAGQGIAIEGGWTGELAGVLDGGVRERSTFHNLLDLHITLDLDLLAGIPSATIFADAYVLNGRQVSYDVGDWQAVSNIDAAPMQQVAEFWWEQRLFDDALRLKVGKVDAYSEFGMVENGGEFLHSSFAASPTTGIVGYPDPASAICAFWSCCEDSVVSLGCFDGSAQEGMLTGGRGMQTFLGAPDDLYFIGEIGTRWCCCESELAGRAAFGVSHHTGDFDRFGGGTKDGVKSWYATLDQQLWREDPADAENLQGLALALLTGIADDEVNELDSHLSIGMQRTGLFEGRDDDVVGFAFSYVEFAADAGFGEDEELAIELVWKVQATPWLVVRPDLQYVIHPGGDLSLDDVWVGMLRVDVTF